jgi:predicted phosphodiesterase
VIRRHSLLLVIGTFYPAFLFAQDFHFVLLGDRTGEAQPDVYEQVWKQIASEKPALAVSAGDSIEGMNDSTAEDEWRRFLDIRKPFSRYPLYLAPGNHDVWSTVSERLYEQYSGHPLHYSFDHGNAHFTMLNNSQSDQLPAGELAFLESDLKAHAAQPVKFVVSHRPFWLLDVAMRNPDFPLRRLAKQYGVQYVIAGHIHQMLHLELDSATYISLPSAAGHLRLSGAYEDGWFFGHILVTIQGNRADFQIKEVTPPRGQGRVSKPADWGMAGLVKK